MDEIDWILTPSLILPSETDLPCSSSRLAFCQMVLDQNLIRHFPGLYKDLGERGAFYFYLLHNCEKGEYGPPTKGLKMGGN